MKSLSPIDLQCGLVRSIVTDLSNGETQELTIKNDRSTCQFFECFMCGDYRVQLRLDWKDLDNQGNPTLDADFINPNTGKHYKSMKAHPSHHTQAQGDGERSYTWEFADESKKLRVVVIWSESVTSTAGFIDSCSVTQTRVGKDVPSLN